MKRKSILKIINLLFLFAIISEMIDLFNGIESISDRIWLYGAVFFVPDIIQLVLMFSFLLLLSNIIIDFLIPKLVKNSKYEFPVRFILAGLVSFILLSLYCSMFKFQFPYKALEIIELLIPFVSITTLFQYPNPLLSPRNKQVRKDKTRVKAYNKKIIVIMVAVFAVALVIYCLYVKLNITPLEQAVRYAFLSNGKNPGKVSDQITTKVFYQINTDRHYKTPSFPAIQRKKLKLTTSFGLLGMKSGYVWMNYSFEALDKNGQVIHGSWDVPITLVVKKNNGPWKIIRKYEAP